MLAKGRIAPQAAQLDLPLIEAVVVLEGGAADHVVIGGEGLDDRSPLLLPPARPAHHLGEEGEGPLPRPEVVHIEGQVGGHHPHQGDVLKVQPLGHHLGAHQDGDPLFSEPLQQLLVGVGGGYGVRVHPQHLRPGEQVPQLLLHPLGAGADEVEQPPAGGARRGQGLRKAAVVAHEPVVGRVVGQLDGAPGALGHLPALPAGHHPAGPPAVEEQNSLLLPLEVVLQLRAQDGAHRPGVALAQLLLQIDDKHLGQGLLVVAGL